MPGTQRQLQKENTKRKIIDSAIGQFAKDGFIVTRTSDIAAASKVSHGTIFAHFATRELLMDEVIGEVGSRIADRLHELVDRECGMKEVLAAHLKGISEYEAFYTRLVSENHLLNDSARNSLTMIQSAISFHIIQVAEREIKKGSIKKMPVHLLFNTWVGLIHYYLINSNQFAPGESVIERYGSELLIHFLNLIMEERR